MRTLTKESINDYESNLVNEEKSQITIEKYIRDVKAFADILSHSSVNTTRIYTMESGAIHRKQIQKLGLLRE